MIKYAVGGVKWEGFVAKNLKENVRSSSVLLFYLSLVGGTLLTASQKSFTGAILEPMITSRSK